MTQQEKMVAGQMYYADDQNLAKQREQAKSLCFEYNHLKPSDLENRINIMKKLLGKTKKNFWFEPTFWCDYGYNIEIGENFYANHNLVILDGNQVKFGDHVLIGPNCGFYTAGHPLDFEIRNQGLEYAKPIEVGSNCWFGGNVVVLPGVKIGSGCVIGAGSVVTKNIPQGSLAYGNPCKVQKKLK